MTKSSVACGSIFRLLAVALLAWTTRARAEEPRAGSTYVGSTICGSCHAEQLRAWSESLHAWAMKPSTPGEAAAAFDGKPVPWGNQSTATPRRDGDSLAVEMASPEGSPNRWPVKYFLGHRPIEQHLAAFPGGRLQALPVGFDTGRRDWFDIFAGDPREPADWGHWTNRGMTANTQCLYCHTTGFVKGYRAATDDYQTSWAEAGVGCESCHGAGSAHVEARRASTGAARDSYATPSGLALLDVCATCHALRREVQPGFQPGGRFLDFFEPVLLDGPEYHPDGQIRAESYEWASFQQSRKFRAGISCPSCHEPHGAGLRKQGNDLCLTCHAEKLADASHTHHLRDSPGAQCPACHMPETVYMARDARRDHSFSLPDPQATLDLGVPNACDRCHAEKGAAWAASRVNEWFGESAKRKEKRELAKTIADGRRGDPAAVAGLLSCVKACPDAIHKASAARLLEPSIEQPGVRAALLEAARDAEALLRWSAVWALARFPPADGSATAPLIEAARDPVRIVRLEAAWGLRAGDSKTLTEPQRAAVAAVLDEWRSAMAFQAEHPETHHTLGVFHAERGETKEAEEAYRRAIRMAPDSVPPRYNLAMLLAARGQTDEVVDQLTRVRALDPGLAPAAYALGVARASAGKWREAVTQFTECLKIDPHYPGALDDLTRAYVELGEGQLANVVLEAALDYPGSHTEALRALVYRNLELDDRKAARYWARRAVAEDPALAEDPRIAESLAAEGEATPR